MKFSIVMPCLFRRKEHKNTVLDCIDSVRKHSSDYEFIIVDDGSPLDTKFLKDNADNYIRHDKPMGIAYGWNDGIGVAKGDYIVIINDDIVVRPGWLEAMEKCFEIENCGVSGCSVEHLPNGMGIEECRTWFPGSCFMLSRNTIDKVGLFDEQFVPYNYEDIDYWTRVYKAGFKLIRNYAVQVQHKEGQVIHSFDNNGIADSLNRQRYIKKWGFDPIPILYHGTAKFPWE